jgi:hypothetical protein
MKYPSYKLQRAKEFKSQKIPKEVCSQQIPKEVWTKEHSSLTKGVPLTWHDQKRWNSGARNQESVK